MSKLSVIKLGGSALDQLPKMMTFVKSVLAEQPAVVVHGGGPQINQALKDLGHQPTFYQGLRTTDAKTLEVATQVLAGSVNKKLVAELQGVGVNATGVSGVDGGTVIAQLKDNGALGFVGSDLSVNPALLKALLQSGFTPVVAPIGVTKEGQILNINADTTAAAIAAGIGATELTFLTDVPGVLDDQGLLVPTLTQTTLEELQHNGAISAGMLPKLEGALEASRLGVEIVRIKSPENGTGTLIKNERQAA